MERIMRAALTALWVAGLLWTAGAEAQPGPVIEGAVEAWLDSGLAPDGVRLPQRHGAPMVPVTLTLAHQATPEMLQRLGSLGGVELRWVEGRWLHRGRLVPALVSERGLRALSRWTEIRRVTAGVGRGPVPPLDHTTSLVGVAAARQRWEGESALTGRGVTLADLDTSVDVFHPDFFAADGGAWDWLDVDDDGRLTPGVDAVDLDGDGEPGEGEVLQVLRALPMSFSPTVEDLPVRPSYFDASWDWLYADTDGDGERDYGPNAGFDDDTPAFGEPLFVVDDIDLDGRLARVERLLRLSTSRVRAVMLTYPTGAVRVFRRGEDLTDLPDAPFGQGAYGMPEAMHATGVLSIAAGGVPHLGRPMTGFAPEAEILVSYDGGWDAVASTMWALDEGADVVLHEYAPWALVTLDGSDPLSEVIDESTDDEGALHVCPVGNTGGVRKHAMAALEPAEVAELVMAVPDWGFQYIAASLHWRPVPSNVSVALVGPSGSRYELSSSPGGQEIEGSEGWVWVDTTAGGTRMVHLQLQGAPPAGSWLFEVSNDGDEPVTVHGFVQDEISGWGSGGRLGGRIRRRT